LDVCQKIFDSQFLPAMVVPSWDKAHSESYCFKS
jgi:hypothetical protein